MWFLFAKDHLGQPALPPVPAVPAVLAGNEVVPVQNLELDTIYPRISRRSEIVTTDIVPSTSNTQRHFRHRDPQVSKLFFFIYLKETIFYFRFMELIFFPLYIRSLIILFLKNLMYFEIIFFSCKRDKILDFFLKFSRFFLNFSLGS